jgi:hypothetical protein
MSPNRLAFRAVLTLTGIVALSLASATPVAAAIVGSLTSTQARPGDQVTLTAQSLAGQTQTVYLISTADFEGQIARFGRQVCNTAGQFALGSFTWGAETGSLTFTVPDVAGGEYYFQVHVPNTSPDCWRIGGGSGPLVLTVLAGTASGHTPGTSAVNPLVAVVLVAAVAVATGVVVRLTRRPA